MHDTDLDRVKYVEDFVDKLHKVSLGFTIIKTFTALRPPIFHLKVDNEDTMRQAYQLPDVKFIEANAAHMKAQQHGAQPSNAWFCGIQVSGILELGLEQNWGVVSSK